MGTLITQHALCSPNCGLSMQTNSICSTKFSRCTLKSTISILPPVPICCDEVFQQQTVLYIVKPPALTQTCAPVVLVILQPVCNMRSRPGSSWGLQPSTHTGGVCCLKNAAAATASLHTVNPVVALQLRHAVWWCVTLEGKCPHAAQTLAVRHLET